MSLRVEGPSIPAAPLNLSPIQAPVVSPPVQGSSINPAVVNNLIVRAQEIEQSYRAELAQARQVVEGLQGRLNPDNPEHAPLIREIHRLRYHLNGTSLRDACWQCIEFFISSIKSLGKCLLYIATCCRRNPPTPIPNELPADQIAPSLQRLTQAREALTMLKERYLGELMGMYDVAYRRNQQQQCQAIGRAINVIVRRIE